MNGNPQYNQVGPPGSRPRTPPGGVSSRNYLPPPHGPPGQQPPLPEYADPLADLYLSEGDRLVAARWAAGFAASRSPGGGVGPLPPPGSTADALILQQLFNGSGGYVSSPEHAAVAHMLRNTPPGGPGYPLGFPGGSNSISPGSSGGPSPYNAGLPPLGAGTPLGGTFVGAGFPPPGPGGAFGPGGFGSGGPPPIPDYLSGKGGPPMGGPPPYGSGLDPGMMGGGARAGPRMGASGVPGVVGEYGAPGGKWGGKSDGKGGYGAGMGGAGKYNQYHYQATSKMGGKKDQWGGGKGDHTPGPGKNEKGGKDYYSITKETSPGGKYGASPRNKGSAGGKTPSAPTGPGVTGALYQIRMRGTKMEIAEVLPHLLEFCRDQFGSRVIQQKLQTSAAHEKQSFYLALRPHVKELVVDPFGNYVVQKFFERGNREHREGLAVALKGQALTLSYHVFGCWVMQRMMEVLDTNPTLQKELALELEGDLIGLISNQNGNHVVQACIENMPPENTGFIVRALVNDAKTMARHTYGCRVLQRIVERCQPTDVEPILDELLPDIDDLVRDEYGNYVIQSVAERTNAPRRAQVVDFVVQNLAKLSLNKYASNVCEKVLMYSEEADTDRITEVILGRDDDPEPPVLVMVRHRYANYCVQKMLEKMSPSSPHVPTVAKRLKLYIPQIRNYNYGKHILTSMFKLGIIEASELAEHLAAGGNSGPAGGAGRGDGGGGGKDTEHGKGRKGGSKGSNVPSRPGLVAPLRTPRHMMS